MAEFRATLMAQHMGQAHQNVLHFQKSGAVTLDASNLANDLKDYWCQIWKPGVASNFTYTNIHVQQLGSTDPPFDLAVSITGTGSAEAGTLPFMALNIRLQTAFGGRHGRGRFYHAGLNPGHLSYGVIQPSIVTYFTGICTSLMARYGPTGASDFQIGVMSRVASSTFHPVTSMTVDTIPRVQRRRNIGVGI